MTMQEVQRRAREQFKGLFDKKPGEIAEAGLETRTSDDTQAPSENANSSKERGLNEAHKSHETVEVAPQMGWFSRFWPVGRRIFTALGIDRCSIL